MRAILPALFALLCGLAPALRAQNAIGTTSLSPASGAVGVATTVTVTSAITDTAVIASSVNLQRLDSAGRIVAVVGSLRDDGLQGDLNANDRTFTLRFTVFEQAPGPLTFRTSASVQGSLVRAFSAPQTFSVTGATATGVAITSPANLAFLSTSPIVVTGTVGDPGARVTVNGVAATVSNRSFQASVPLAEGTNTMTAVATNTGGTTNTASITLTLDTTPPRVAIDSPANGFSTTEASVSVTGLVNDLVVGTINDQQATVTVNGVSAPVANRTFSAPNVPLALGVNTIQAVGRDRTGNSATASVQVTRLPATQPSVRVLSGNNQSGTVGGPLAAPLVAQVLNGQGQPLANTMVVFQVTENNGLVSAGGAAGGSSVAVTSNVQGQAQVTLRLGTRAGMGNNTVEATATGVAGAALFTASGQPTAASKINVDTGSGQTGTVGQALPFPFVVIVTDAGHNRLANVPVTFTVRQGGGSFAGVVTRTANTDGDGRALASLTLGPEEGNENNVVEASFAGNPGMPAAFTASGRLPGLPANTSISGVVLNNSNVPLAGVTMRTFLPNQGGNNAVPMQVGTPVVTNAQGQFRIQPAPVGFVKLMADGSTVAPSGSFPTVEFDLVTVAGRDNTVGLPIYLPRLDTVNRLCVNATTGGTLTLPQSPGFSLTVAPGSATFPGGSRTGCITVTPVNGDKVPMVPGFGQQPRFVVTIQPVGTQFNPPARIAIPNVDGLVPRSKTEMYSFDHDLAAFVSIGSGTVSEDGSVLASDPGVGVVKAGWHCGGNPSPAGGAQTVNVDITTPGPVSVATNATTSISSSGTPAPGTYSWSSSDPSVVEIAGGQSSATVSVRGKAQGMATLTVTYTCESGAMATDSIVVRVGTTIMITSVGPMLPLVLGTNGVISYTIAPPGSSFDSVKLEIRNSANALVFEQAGLPTAAGTHMTSWPMVKWNQGGNAGAFANPRNGPYQVKIIGTRMGMMEMDTRATPVKLVVEADVADMVPGGATATRSAGLNDLADALKIVMSLGGAETVVSGAGSIMVTGAMANMKHVKADAPALNMLADGLYEVLFRDLRDAVGNFADMDNNAANGIQPFKFMVNLR